MSEQQEWKLEKNAIACLLLHADDRQDWNFE